MMGSDKRYQECSWYGKLWRCRHYILVPINTIKSFFSHGLSAIQHTHMSWKIHIGLAQSNMKYYYTSEEVFNNLNDRLNLDNLDGGLKKETYDQFALRIKLCGDDSFEVLSKWVFVLMEELDDLDEYYEDEISKSKER